MITSGQSNLTWGRMAATGGWFNRIRQVASTSPPMRVHWSYLANTIEFVLLSAHPSPQSKRQIDRFSRFCTARRIKCLYFTMSAPSPTIAPFRGGSGPISNTWFLGPIGAHKPNRMLIGSAVFAKLTRRMSLHFTMGRPFSPSKLPLPMGDMNTYLIHGPFGPPKSLTKTASRSLQPFLQGSLPWQTDRESMLFGR